MVCLLLGFVAECAVAKDAMVHRQIEFKRVGTEALMLSLAVPPRIRERRTYPLVICVHGGGWRAGDRGTWTVEHFKNQITISTLARAGYVAVSVDYRLAPLNPFPAAVDDVKSAIQYLADNADAFSIDADRIGILGDSAGGHLALMAGMMNWRGTSEKPFRIRCVVNYYGITDFPTIAMPDGKLGSVVAEFLGSTDPRSEVAAKASPTTHIDRTDPAVITMHGTADTIVAFQQAEVLHQRLRAAGVKGRLYPIVGANHGWADENQVCFSNRKCLRFFRRFLKG